MKENEMKEIAEFMKKIIIDKIDPKIIKKQVAEFRKEIQKVQYCFPAETNAFDYISFK
jgi:glycine hydroxymethyltransferase